MSMFPERTKWFKRPVGWRNLGEINGIDSNDGNSTIYKVHTFCGSRIYIGKENETLFRFCPRCMNKIE